ncbi:MAG: carbohydrate binding family 9 domain-containing protein, partial [Acidobacteria bacterium]|nr:carbohydrate binding family 9 domain-containing protein [Acidobacteriota bacterium]
MPTHISLPVVERIMRLGTTVLRSRFIRLCLFGLCVLAASNAAAQSRTDAEPAAEDKVGKQLRALRITGTPPRIDGHLDDETWVTAPAIEDLVQNEPNSMAAPTERTTIQVAFDDRYVYVAARCYTKDPSQIVSALGRRDTLPPSDLIRIGFDPRHDHSTGYVFHTNPAGVQQDDMFFDDTRYSPDYEAVWEVQTAITAEGWNAEFRIPFSQLRFSLTPGQTMVWGFQVRRDMYRKGEFDRWVPTPRGVQGNVSRYGHLIFDDRVTPPRLLEMLPYGTLRSEDTPGTVADHGFAGGLDLRMGIGTANTLSATFNPDFGQVEQDPAVLNLTVFETFFPEKRPFFLEDSRVFVLPFPQFPVFHSRRIGQRPGRYALQTGDTLVHRPEQTTILGAAKLTGKKGLWTYGAVSALTAAEYAMVDAATTDSSGNLVMQRTERLIEPRTSYNVARVQRDLFDATSNIGGVITGVLRDNDDDAFTGGVDYNFRWKRNAYRMDGHWVGTHAPVSGVLRDGFGGANRFNYSAKHLNVNGHVDHFSRYFRNADLGFLGSRANKTSANAGIGVGQPDPKKYSRSIWGFIGAGQQFNADVVFDRWVNLAMDWQLPTYWSVGWNGGHNFRTLDDLDTRGGPAIVKPEANWLNVFVSSDSRKTWRFGVNGGLTRDDAGGSNDRVGVFLNVQPSTQLQASLSSNYSFGNTAAQWITNSDLDSNGTVDHVYGTLDRNVLDFTARGTYSFTRDLTLQVFLQPFVAVGAYSDIRQLARARSFDFHPASLSYNPNFNTKSLRTNTVLRWQYRPGSTLFVVWNRSAADA